MTKQEFIKEISMVDRDWYTFNEIYLRFPDNFVEIYQSELALADSAYWEEVFIYEEGCLPRSNGDESIYMLRDFLLGMFQDYVINHTDLLEDVTP